MGRDADVDLGLIRLHGCSCVGDDANRTRTRLVWRLRRRRGRQYDARYDEANANRREHAHL
jgi:hypothetical protein